MRAPLMPLRDVVVFPSMVAPLFVGRDRSVAALEYAMENGKTIFMATQREAKVDDPREGDIYQVGTLSTVLQLLRLPDGTVKALIEGRERARITSFETNPDFFMVELEVLDQPFPPDLESEALIRSVVASFDQYAKLNKKIPKEVLLSVGAITDPGALADTVVSHLPIKLEDRQQLLEIIEPNRRLSRLFELLRSEIEILQIERRIKGRVKRQMEKTQREYYLNEQMRAIQKEMGEKDDLKSEAKDLEEKLKSKRMPREARQKIEAEIKKLKMMSPMSAEATVVRNYVDWLMALPWYERTRDKLDLTEAHTILDEDHYGLDKPKERILEFLAVQACSPRRSRAPSCASWALREWARPPWPAPSPGPWGATSSGSPWAGCATRPRYAATAAPTSAPCPARSSSPCAGPAASTRCSAWTRWTRCPPTSGATPPRPCWRCWTRSRTSPSTTTTWTRTTTCPR